MSGAVRVLTFVALGLSTAACSDKASVPAADGSTDGSLDAGCAAAIGLLPTEACPGGSVGGHCSVGEACYGMQGCSPVPCVTGGFCLGPVSEQAVAAQGTPPASLSGTVALATDGTSFTVSDGSISMQVSVNLPAGVTLPLSEGQAVEATTCAHAGMNGGRLLVLRDAQAHLLLVSGVGADASKANCLPAELTVSRRELGCQPFAAPPPDDGGFFGRFALEFVGGIVVGPGEAGKTIAVVGQSFDAHVFEAYWFIEWRGTDVSGAYESFAVFKR